MPFSHNPLAYSTFLDAFGANLFTTQQYDQLAAGSEVAARASCSRYGSLVPTIGPGVE